MGDPAGIGPEITVSAWAALRGSGPGFLVIGDPALYPGARVVADPAEAARIFPQALPVLAVPLAAPLAAPVRAGQPDGANAPAIIEAIAAAARLAMAGAVGGIVTNPISKAALYGAGFAHPGHTEFLGALTGVAQPVMMLAAPALRVVPVTVHVSLRRAIETLTAEAILYAGRVTAAALVRDFAIAAPRLAVAGLNPHAGEGGAMGTEEQTLVAPAIAALRAEGIDATGPWPPDTMFTEAARARYDAAICLYHDQALIPLKTLDMTHGVNVTLGLPIIRTSPDHGTAFDIAGLGRADPSSLVAAIRLAAGMAARRAR